MSQQPHQSHMFHHFGMDVMHSVDKLEETQLSHTVPMTPSNYPKDKDTIQSIVNNFIGASLSQKYHTRGHYRSKHHIIGFA